VEESPKRHRPDASGTRRPVITDFEDFTKMALDRPQLEELVGEAGQCVLNWTTRDGYPVGVVVSYVYRHGSFWTNCASRRRRVEALRARPQTGIVLNKDGKMATYKGDSVIHGTHDADWEQVKTWFYAALSGTERDPDNRVARRFQDFLDGPNQVIIETRARLVVSFDFGRFMAATQAAIVAYEKGG
jgi:hypothetical protein